MPDRRTKKITLASSAARTANGAGSAFDVGRFTEGLLFVEVTATAGTNPTLDLDLETGPADDDLGYIHTEPAQITAAGKTLVKLSNLGRWVRLSWQIGGGSPSFTFQAILAVKN